jgi:hypothetical protein
MVTNSVQLSLPEYAGIHSVRQEFVTSDNQLQSTLSSLKIDFSIIPKIMPRSPSAIRSFYRV